MPSTILNNFLFPDSTDMASVSIPSRQFNLVVSFQCFAVFLSLLGIVTVHVQEELEQTLFISPPAPGVSHQHLSVNPHQTNPRAHTDTTTNPLLFSEGNKKYQGSTALTNLTIQYLSVAKRHYDTPQRLQYLYLISWEK